MVRYRKVDDDRDWLDEDSEEGESDSFEHRGICIDDAVGVDAIDWDRQFERNRRLRRRRRQRRRRWSRTDRLMDF